MMFSSKPSLLHYSVFILLAVFITSGAFAQEDIVKPKKDPVKTKTIVEPEPPKPLSDAHVTFIWQGDGNAKISINKTEYFLKNNVPYVIDLTAGEGYTFSIIKPGKPYYYDDYLIFDKGNSKYYVGFTGDDDKKKVVVSKQPIEIQNIVVPKQVINEQVINTNTVIDKPPKNPVTFIWKGDEDVALILDNEKRYIAARNSLQIDMLFDKAYNLIVETLKKKYELEKLIMFPEKNDTVFLWIDNGNLKYEKMSQIILYNEKIKAIINERIKSSKMLNGEIIDKRDGKVYKTIKVGDQVWMAENLNFETASGSKCYNDDLNNCKKYGRLYNRSSALKACPDGWHLPDENEWTTLFSYCKNTIPDNKVIYTYENNNAKYKNLGNFINDSTFYGVNLFGLSILPFGYYDSNEKKFKDLNGISYFWSSSKWKYDRYLEYQVMYVFEDACGLKFNYDLKYFFSVRCIKDE